MFIQWGQSVNDISALSNHQTCCIWPLFDPDTTPNSCPTGMAKITSFSAMSRSTQPSTTPKPERAYTAYTLLAAWFFIPRQYMCDTCGRQLTFFFKMSLAPSEMSMPGGMQTNDSMLHAVPVYIAYLNNVYLGSKYTYVCSVIMIYIYNVYKHIHTPVCYLQSMHV